MREINPEVFGKIRFSRVPDGEEPLEVRRDWLAVIEMTCLYFDEDARCARTIITRKRLPPRPAYIVFQQDAIEALAEVSPAAARYWERAGFPRNEFAIFGFDPKNVEVVKPVMKKAEFDRLRRSCLDA